MNATDMQLLCVKPQLHMTAIFVGSVMVHSTLSPFHKYWYTTLVFTAPFFVSRFPHFLSLPFLTCVLFPSPFFKHSAFSSTSIYYYSSNLRLFFHLPLKTSGLNLRLIYLYAVSTFYNIYVIVSSVNISRSRRVYQLAQTLKVSPLASCEASCVGAYLSSDLSLSIAPLCLRAQKCLNINIGEENTALRTFICTPTSNPFTSAYL